MGLKKMYMALTLARFKNHEMQIAAAGMPFPLIYRALSGEVEEVQLKGMPLGGFTDFPYQELNIKLHKEDSVLFMSDGFEELFNRQNEMLGMEQVKSLFAEHAAKSPDEIIESLIQAGQEWADGRNQEDDITFVVIKAK